MPYRNKFSPIIIECSGVKGVVIMEQIDPNAAQRVWQRVRSEQPIQSAVELPLIAAEAEIAGILAGILGKNAGKHSALGEVVRQCRQNMACLRGICRLRQGAAPQIPKFVGKPGNRDSALRKCYVNCIKLAAQYDVRGDDPEYGCVFADLAATKRKHCKLLLEYLGESPTA